VFRLGRQETTQRAICGRRAASGAGWVLYRSQTQLLFTWTRANLTTGTVTVNLGGNGTSRGWHYALIKADAATDQITVATDLGAMAGGPIAAETTEEPAGVAFRVGACAGLTAANAQVLAVVDMTAAAPDAGVAAWWRFGADPNGIITTTTRASEIGTIVGRDNEHGEYLAAWSANQLPFSFRADMLTDSKLGLRTTRAWSNLVTDTRLTQATLSNATLDADVVDSPWGFRDGCRIVKTTGAGQALISVGSVSNGAVYRYGVHLWADAPMSASLHFRLNGAIVRTLTVTLSSRRTRIVDTITPLASGPAEVVIEPGPVGGGAGAAVYASDPFCTDNAGDNAFDLMSLSIGGTSTIAASAFGWTGSNHQKGDVGTLRVRFAADQGELPVSGSPSAIMSTDATANRHEIRGDSTEKVGAQVWSSAGAAQTAGDSAVDQPIEFPMVAELEWSATTPIATAVHSRHRVNGGAWITGATAPWTANDTQPVFSIGHRSGGNNFPGIIDLVEIYSARA
jgi:hypothetical protein